MPSQRTSSQTASRDCCCYGAWYEHSKKVLEAACFVESRLEQGLYYLQGPSGLEALVHTHVDDFRSAFKKASKKYKDALQHLVHEFHLKQQSGLVVYCGRTTCRDGNHIKVTNQVNDESRMHEH